MTANSASCFYSILGIDPDASEDMIRKAYRKRALRWHPDKNIDNPDAEHLFKILQKAYETLSAKESKEKYDAQLHGDDGEKSVNHDLLKLHVGNRLSEMYMNKISKWIEEYPHIEFVNNYEAEISSIVLSTLEQHTGWMGDLVEQCPVCHELVQNKKKHTVHMSKKYLSYLATHASDFHDALKKVSSKGWQWQPIPSAPAIHRQLWESIEWQNFSSLTSKMLLVQKLLLQTDGIDKMFSQTTHEKDPNIEQIAVDLTSSKCALDLADITELKRLIDSDNDIFPISANSHGMVKSGKDDKYRKFGRICIVRNDNHPVLSQLLYDVPEQLPIYTSYGKEAKCFGCHKNLYFFNDKHHCRMCGELHCSRCLLWQSCRHLGFVSSVFMCKPCTTKKISIIIHTISQHVLQQLKQKQHEHLAQYLALLRAYNYLDGTFYESVTRQLLSNKQFMTAFQYADYIHQSENDWISLAERLLHERKYNETATCLRIITQRFKRRTQYWLSLGNKYAKENINALDECDQIQFAILAYREAGLSWEGILRKAVNESRVNVRLLLVRYVAHAHKKTSKQWKLDGESRICHSHKHAIGLCCLHLAQLSDAEWVSTLEKLVESKEYNVVVSILRTLRSNTVETVMTQSSPMLRFLCDEIRETSFDMAGRLQPIIESSSVHHILAIAALVNLRQNNEVWNSLKDHCLFQSKRYDIVAICHKVQAVLNLPTSYDWMDQGILENNSIVYDLKDSMQCNWIEMGNYYLQSTHYDTALNCFFRAMRNRLIDRTTVFEHILSLLKELPQNIALWYAIVVYREAQDLFSIACESVQHLSGLLDITRHQYVAFTLSALHHLNNIEKQMPASLIAMNLCFISNLSTSEEHFIEGLHFIESISASNRQMSRLQQRYDEYVYERDYKNIRRAIDISFIALANCLKQVTNVRALRKCQQVYCNKASIGRSSSLNEVIFYMIDATIDKLEGRHLLFIQKLQHALACSHNKEGSVALAILIQDPLLSMMRTQSILSDLSNLPTTDPSEWTYLHAPITYVPERLQYENRLKPNSFVRLLQGYDEGIVKNTNLDSIESAMAYIDLCMAISDRTAVASSWILACLHIYQEFSKLICDFANQPKVYAYRNLINELAINAYLLAREYLAPHIQVYFYRLALSLILQTNRLFSRLIESKKIPQTSNTIQFVFDFRKTTIINQILKSMIRFVKIAPITQIDPLLNYDLCFIEMCGFDYLQEYLRLMGQDNIDQDLFVYHYYFLHGIWDGWISNQDFQLARQQSMQSLLNKKQWTITDVERLLNDPLIPRTSDGWLFSQRKSLYLSERKRYAKVDGIKFNYETGEVTFLLVPARYAESTALFDSNDITEVFTKGLTNAIVSLDQPDQDFLFHPFQEIKYLPASLANTKYLTTLLHTDYLLKFITTGMEINSKWPFATRLASEGFMKRLPKRLQELLIPLPMRDRIFSRGNIHRFWIEAGDPTYEYTFNEKRHELIYRVSGVKMYVKQHLMKYDDEGNLIDDDRFDGEPDHSREAQFAKAFTENYDEIGAYFPEFLRLKELTKLGVLLNFVRHRHRSLKENLAEDVDVRNICKNLCDNRRGLEYPLHTKDNVNRIYDDTLQYNNVASYEITYEQKNDLLDEICSELKKEDAEVVDEMTKLVCNYCYSSKWMQAEQLIEHWLCHSSNDNPTLWSCKRYASVELVSFIRKAIAHQKQSLIEAIESMQICLEVDQSVNLGD